MKRRPPRSTLFPNTTLFRSHGKFEMVHKILTYHRREISQHATLLLPTVSRHNLAPLFQTLYVALVSQPHQHDEHVKELPVFTAGFQSGQRFQPVAIGQTGYPSRSEEHTSELQSRQYL